MKVIHPLEYYDPTSTDILCFLAGGCGNIEWRNIVIQELESYTLNNLVLIDPYNPNIESAFKQIQWEYNYLNYYNDCPYIFSMYFDKYTDQPISMYELGRASVLSKQKEIKWESDDITGTILTQYGYPCIVSVHKEAPKKQDIICQCGLAKIQVSERTPQEHAHEILKEYNNIKCKMC